MLRLFSRLLLSLLLCLSLLTPCFAEGFPQGGALTPEQGNALLEKHAAGGLTLLDVRTPGEFAAGHAPNALHIPVSELQGRIAEVPEGPVLIVCRSGRRAQRAAGILLDSGRSPEGLWFLSGYSDYSGGKVRFHD
ncbi:MAG: rhodanese-like domain-containing protein [Mailhella sp.]|jgi:rhodanese-related sulfurtransferase|nr:rhodanese-like domain-containing protein [Mailhella sp.]